MMSNTSSRVTRNRLNLAMQKAMSTVLTPMRAAATKIRSISLVNTSRSPLDTSLQASENSKANEVTADSMQKGKDESVVLQTSNTQTQIDELADSYDSDTNAQEASTQERHAASPTISPAQLAEFDPLVPKPSPLVSSTPEPVLQQSAARNKLVKGRRKAKRALLSKGKAKRAAIPKAKKECLPATTEQSTKTQGATEWRIECYDTCQYGHSEQGDQTRCCVCMEWFHDECAKIPKEYCGLVWSCDGCRKIPKEIRHLSSKVDHINKLLENQNDILTCFHRSAERMIDTHLLLSQQLNEQEKILEQLRMENASLKEALKVMPLAESGEELNIRDARIRFLQNENILLREELCSGAQPQVPNCAMENSQPPPDRDAQPQRASTEPLYSRTASNYLTHVQQAGVIPVHSEQSNREPVNARSSLPGAMLLGSSTTKYVNPKELFNAAGCDVGKDCRQFRVQDLSEKVRDLQVPKLLIHCGTNNVTKEPSHITIQRLQRLEILIQRNSHIKTVALSSLLNRRDSYDADCRTTRVNHAIKLICEKNNWVFVDNSNVDLSCIGRDGVHPNREGTARLTTNFKWAFAQMQHVSVYNSNFPPLSPVVGK